MYTYEEGIEEGLRRALEIVESELEYPQFEAEILSRKDRDKWEKFRKYFIDDLVLATTKSVVQDTKKSIAQRIRDTME